MASIKNFLPRSIFGRALIILSAPILLVQLVSNFVFLDRHLDSVTKLLAQDLTQMTKTLLYIRGQKDIVPIAQEWYNFTYRFQKGARLKKNHPVPEDWAEQYLMEALDSSLKYPYELWQDDQHLVIAVQLPEGVATVRFWRKRLMSKTTQLVFYWAIGTSLLSLFIAALFMRNQLRPLRDLTLSTEELGKGRDIPDFQPRGAYEIRKVGLAFNTMKNSIKRQVNQRRDMLASISHDLRTPLTRMKLGLALLKENETLADIKEDIKEMEQMVQEYLDFVRQDIAEPLEETDVVGLLQQVQKRFEKNIPLTLDTPPSLVMALRVGAFKRAVKNLLANASLYAKRGHMSLTLSQNHVILVVEDDGPGIPLHHRQEVFRPFYRIEASRNHNTGGIGLGLSIVQDIIHNHGGTIQLEDATLGGLRVVITLPL